MLPAGVFMLAAACCSACGLSRAAESFHVVVPACHETAVNVGEPQGMEGGSDRSDGEHCPCGRFAVEAFHKQIHQKHGHVESCRGHQHLHFGVSSRTCELAVEVDSGVVVDCELEQEGEYGS